MSEGSAPLPPASNSATARSANPRPLSILIAVGWKVYSSSAGGSQVVDTSEGLVDTLEGCGRGKYILLRAVALA